MITVSTEVIQQSIRPDNFMNGGANKKSHNGQFTPTPSNGHYKANDNNEFDYNYANTSPPIDNDYTNYTKYNSEDDNLTDVDENNDDNIISYNKQMSYSVTATNNNINKNIDFDQMSFEKVDINEVQLISPKIQKSGLSVLITDTDNNNTRYHSQTNLILSDNPMNNNNNNNDNNTININIIMLFSEFNFNKNISVSIQIFHSDMLVEQVINQTIHKFETTHPLKKLRSYNSLEYELRSIDDDDYDDDDLNEDELDPPLKRNTKICNFIDTKSKTCYMVMCCNSDNNNNNNNNNNNKKTKSVKFLQEIKDRHQLKQPNDHEEKVAARRRAQTMEQIEQQTKATFIRVYIPGPISESSVLLSIENNELLSTTLRDLFTILNRKRKSAKFNGQYFDFYYKLKEKQYGAISNSIKIIDLLSKELIILPKILSMATDNINEQEAFQFELVKLANQHKQYKAFKIDKFKYGTSKKKKTFLLEIDRYRFVKTSLDSSTVFSTKNKNQMKVPVPIQDIISVVATEKSNGHNKHHDQFTITYSIPHNSTTKTKTYQMANTQIRNEIVDKLNFLCRLRRLQG